MRTEKDKPAEPSPEVAPTHPDLCDCATCWQAIAEARRRTILKREAEITNLLAVPAVAPRETQTELRTRIKQLRYAAERAISQGKDEVQIDAMELLQFVERLEGGH